MVTSDSQNDDPVIVISNTDDNPPADVVSDTDNNPPADVTSDTSNDDPVIVVSNTDDNPPADVVSDYVEDDAENVLNSENESERGTIHYGSGGSRVSTKPKKPKTFKTENKKVGFFDKRFNVGNLTLTPKHVIVSSVFGAAAYYSAKKTAVSPAVSLGYTISGILVGLVISYMVFNQKK